MLAVVDVTILLAAAIPGTLALIGVIIQQANARRERQEKQRLADAAAEARMKADQTRIAVDAWQKLVEQIQEQQKTERSAAEFAATTSQAQIAHLGEQLNIVQASNLKYQDENQKCYEERADLLKRVIELEHK